MQKWLFFAFICGRKYFLATALKFAEDSPCWYLERRAERVKSPDVTSRLRKRRKNQPRFVRFLLLKKIDKEDEMPQKSEVSREFSALVGVDLVQKSIHYSFICLLYLFTH